MKNIIKIKGKVTFEGWISFVGFFFFLFGINIAFILSEYTQFWFSFLLIPLFGFMLFLNIKGVLIDLEEKRVKLYIHCLFFKLGKWKPIDDIERIVLEYKKEGGGATFRLTLRGSLHVEYFPVSFWFVSGKKIFIQEFSNYEKAKSFLDKYSELLEIEKKDCYEIMLEEIAKLRGPL